jgi:hypothetical protein
VDGVAVCAVELNCVDVLVIVPVTEVILQAPVVAEPPTLDPAKVYAEPEHIVEAFPALTVAGAFTVKTTLDVSELHEPAGSFVVKVKVTVPVFPAIGVKVIVDGVAV